MSDPTLDQVTAIFPASTPDSDAELFDDATLDEMCTNVGNPDWSGIEPEAAWHARRLLRHAREQMNVVWWQAGARGDEAETLTADMIRHLNAAARDIQSSALHALVPVVQGHHAHNPAWRVQEP